ncbi:hypothetical protein J587_3615 [Acinetobacter baumannii 144107]|nr:hypothetical protein J587_3615 [Acinetobacter baumannii 144107]
MWLTKVFNELPISCLSQYTLLSRILVVIHFEAFILVFMAMDYE